MKLTIAILVEESMDQDLIDSCDKLFCYPQNKGLVNKDAFIIDSTSIHKGYQRIETLKDVFTHEGILGILINSANELVEISNVSDRPVYTNYLEDGIPTFPHFLKDKQLRLLPQTAGLSVSDSMSDEQGFLSICKRILKEGEGRDDRTGVGTYSLFSPPVIQYDLTGGKIPCFTTKRVPWKSTVKELLWFISGGTSSKDLESQGVNWWRGNTTKEFLENRGLTNYEEGELGPMYGWQWRHSGAKYIPETLRCFGCGHGEGGVDQLDEVIHNIKNNPTSRRLIVTSYVPQDIEKAVLPPCHSFIQFYVDKNGLSCTLYQRSADMFLGAQINVLSYSILTHMIASLCGIPAYRFYHHIGDAHIYKNHVTQMVEQMERSVHTPPTISIRGGQGTIDDFVLEDFGISGYSPAPYIRAPMAV